MRNFASCHAVADFFLLQVDPFAGDSICNLKLQKLCYYAQGWALALQDKPMFSERIEAWAHGPASPSLYGRFRKYGWQSIDPLDLRTNPKEDLSGDDRRILEAVWVKYGKFTGRQLEDMTHREAPWLIARGATPVGEKCTTEITHDSMRAYFKTLLHDSSRSNSRATAT